VPTLWDLLTTAERRNGGKSVFYVGDLAYDTLRVGLRSDEPAADGRISFAFDTREPGNSNQGHSGKGFGTDLSDTDKRALIQYLKMR